MRTRIKFCGITRVEDAKQAVLLGADAIGLVFYEKSERYVSAEIAQKICISIPPFVCRVGLFVNETKETIENFLKMVPLDILQFHGDEEASLCESFTRPYIKAIRVRDACALMHSMSSYKTASAILLDTYHKQAYGGMGETFEWSLIPKQRECPIILAGGLNSTNVIQAICQVKPYAVDVSSGIERSPGVKDPAKMEAFIRSVRIADET